MKKGRNRVALCAAADHHDGVANAHFGGSFGVELADGSEHLPEETNQPAWFACHDPLGDTRGQVGVRAGVSADPDQFAFGGHVETFRASGEKAGGPPGRRSARPESFRRGAGAAARASAWRGTQMTASGPSASPRATSPASVYQLGQTAEV